MHVSASMRVSVCLVAALVKRYYLTKRFCKQVELEDTSPQGSKTVVSHCYTHTRLLGFTGVHNLRTDREGKVESSVINPPYIQSVVILAKLPSHCII